MNKVCTHASGIADFSSESWGKWSVVSGPWSVGLKDFGEVVWGQWSVGLEGFMNKVFTFRVVVCGQWSVGLKKFYSHGPRTTDHRPLTTSPKTPNFSARLTVNRPPQTGSAEFD